MAEEKKYYVTIKGEKVEVTEEVYRAYVRPIRAEQRRKRREWKCRIRGPKGNLIRCPHDCKTCEYALAGKNATGNMLSLDGIKAAGIEIEDRDLNIEEMFIEREERALMKNRLHMAISMLNDRQQQMVKMVYFENLTQEEVARRLGVNKQAISNAMQRIYASIKKNLEK